MGVLKFHIFWYRVILDNGPVRASLRVGRGTPTSVSPAASSDVRSIPEQKARPAPEIIITRTSSLWSASSNAESRSCHIASFIALLANKQKGDLYITLILIVISILFLIMGGFFLAIFYMPFQDKASILFVGFLNRIIGIFTKKFQIKPTWASDFLKDFNTGFFKLFRNPGYFTSISLLTMVIWIFWLGVMYFTFLAFRYQISIGHLFTGFSIGQLIGVLSMIPGGAGTMEGSMALVFAAVEIPLETALSSIILFRLSFYIVPFFLSLPFYFTLKKKLT